MLIFEREENNAVPPSEPTRELDLRMRSGSAVCGSGSSRC